MKRVTQFFEDDNGQLSAMRLYSFVALWVAILISLRPAPNMDLVLIWVAAAFAPKVIQKLIEKIAEKKLQERG